LGGREIAAIDGNFRVVNTAIVTSIGTEAKREGNMFKKAAFEPSDGQGAGIAGGYLNIPP
jgi:hypothetical protein